MLENINTNIKNQLGEAAMNVGIVAMSGAMILALADHAGVKHPALVTVGSEATPVGEHSGMGNDMRSQREDAGPHNVTYGVHRNSPPRSGRA